MPENEPPFNHPVNRVADQPPYNEPVPTARRQPKRSKKVIIVGLLAILVLAALVLGGLKLLGSKSADQPAANITQDQEPATEPALSDIDVPNAENTATYQNSFLGVTLTHPETWTATEPESKDSVRLESPGFSYQALDGTEVSGNFRLYIRKGARAVDSTYIGRGVAIQPSEKLTYAKPAVGQRTETNMTLFGYDTPDNFALLLIAGNYSLNKGDTLGPGYGKEAETYIIAGGFSSPELKDDLARRPVSPELLQTSNAYKQALEILKSLQLR